MSHNFAAFQPKTMKLPKITYFVVISKYDNINFFENVTAQDIAGWAARLVLA